MNELGGINGQHGRPNDRRGFLHKKILGLVGSGLSFAGNVIPLPGANILRQAGRIATGFSRGGPPPPRGPISRFPQPTDERTVIGLPEGFTFGAGAGRGEGAGVIFQSGTGTAVNGACPCPPAKGNRRVNAAGQCAPPGFHWNVASYFRKGGACSRFEPGFVEEGTVLVKNRRMNNANGGAQTKALKRIEGGQDHAKRILRATGWRTISKQSSREMRMRRRGGHR